MDKIIYNVLKTLENNNYESYIVGGYVRDMLLGNISMDIDITTKSRPKEVLELFKEYDVKITKINYSSNGEKDIVFKVTDDELISKTGGIVQGMSGSPIIQNNMLVGAVTHVIVNNPEKGYAIFAETMLEESNAEK